MSEKRLPTLDELRQMILEDTAPASDGPDSTEPKDAAEAESAERTED
jgi:hypothetical protein